jgi:hypothetical protein
MADKLSQDFYSEVEQLTSTDAKVLWYMTVIVNLSSLNYPDLIPSVWQHISESLFPKLSHEERFRTAQKLREALIKSVGIVGAAKVC